MIKKTTKRYEIIKSQLAFQHSLNMNDVHNMQRSMMEIIQANKTIEKGVALIARRLSVYIKGETE